MVVFGIVLASLGASLPVVISRFAIDKREAGGLLALMSLCILAASLVFGPLVDRRGYKGMLLFSFVAIALGIEAIAFAPSLSWLRAGVVLTGFSGGLVNGAGNALVADVSGERRAAALTFVGAFFGVGAAGVPLLLALLSEEVSHAAILAAAGAIVLIPLALAAVAHFPPAKQPRGFPLAHARGLLRDPVLVLLGLMLFLESGMESTVGGWITTFFAEELRAPVARAPMYLALFWFGLMVTRLALGALLVRLSGVRVLFVSVAVAMVSAAWLVWTGSVAAGAAGVFFLGCGFAPVFPVIYAFVGDRHTHIAGTALSVVIAMALVGGMLMPYAVGVLAGLYGLRASFVIVPVALVAMTLLLASVARRLG